MNEVTLIRKSLQGPQAHCQTARLGAQGNASGEGRLSFPHWHGMVTLLPANVAKLLLLAGMLVFISFAGTNSSQAAVSCLGVPHIPGNTLPDNWYFDVDQGTCASSDYLRTKRVGGSVTPEPTNGFRIASDDDDLSPAEAYGSVGQDGNNQNANAFTTCNSTLISHVDDPSGNGDGNYQENWDNTAYRVCGTGGGARYVSAGPGNTGFVGYDRYVIELEMTGANDGITYTVTVDISADDGGQAGSGHIVHSITVSGGAFDNPPNSKSVKGKVQDFLAARSRVIASNEPDLKERLNTVSVSQSNPFGLSLTGDSTLSNFQARFKSSYLGLNSGSGERPLGWDAWAEGKLIRKNNDHYDSKITLFNVGADYKINPNLLIGVMGQLDYWDEADETDYGEWNISGHGWMAGPYVVSRLQENLYFDARLAAGTSSNAINQVLGEPCPTVSIGKECAYVHPYDLDFDTFRWLARAQLTGEFEHDVLKINPFVRVFYMEEQAEYTDVFTRERVEQTTALGTLTFGPEVSADLTAKDGSVWSPYAKLAGTWEFAHPGTTQTGDQPPDLYARAELGLRGTDAEGRSSMRASVFMDGIGEDLASSYGLSLRFSYRLN